MENKIPMLLTLDYKTFLNVPRLYSYPNLHFYIIIGGRGIGKTTGLSAQVISNYNKRGKEFVYVRRYMEEIRKTKELFTPVAKGVTTRGIAKGAYEYIYNKKRIGYCIALTAQNTIKSGLNFTNVDTMIFDECILPRGGLARYLNDEITLFLELVSTVFRARKDYKVFLLGNNADIFNPYWEYFNIPNFKDIYIDKSRCLYCEKAKNSPQLLEIEEETPLYKLTQGTTYWDYHYNNEILSSGRTPNVIPKPMKLTLICRLVLNVYTLNIYRYKVDNIYVELKEKKIKDSYTYVITENNNANQFFVNLYRKSDAKKFIDAMYYDGGDYYDSQKAFALLTTFMEMI